MSTFLQEVNIEIPDGIIAGRALKDAAEIQTAQLAQRVLATQAVPLSAMRVWDAMASGVPGTAATDDLGLLTGTPGTDAPKLSAGDLKAAGATSRKVAFELEVPPNYDAGQTFEVRIRAGMETTLADVSATVGLEVYKPDGAGAVGANLCSTAAQNCNSLTPANLDFTINGSSLVAGDKLICIVTVAVNDAATATAVSATIYSVNRRCDTRG